MSGSHFHTVSIDHLVGGESHKLFGGSFPDRGYGDNPANVVADDGGGRLIAELLHSVLVEETQCVSEHRQSRVRATIGRLDRRLLVQVLQSINAMLIDNIFAFHSLFSLGLLSSCNGKDK